jgi:cellulose synthase/poly-beta-1,6-N-acetylglucosamine synthase-like glycosyltransferase
MISIIIIVKNDRAVEDTLISLKDIKLPEKTEIIVIDASKKETLLDIKKKFPKVRWIYYKNKTEKKITIPEQRNLGLEKSNGDIIVFLDSNCIPKKDWLYELTKPILDDRESIVAGWIRSYKKSIYDNYYKGSKYVEESPTGNLAFRKNILYKVGYFDESLSAGEDIDFTWRAVDNGYKIRFNPKAIIYHDWGNLKKEINRGIRYGAAATKLYKKHTKRIKNIFRFGHEMYSIYTIFFFIYMISLIPVTIFFHYYPLFILIPLIKNIKNRPIRKIIFDFFYGLGILKELLSPKKFIK